MALTSLTIFFHFFVFIVTVSPLMMKELKRIISESEVMKEDDQKWPKKNVVGKQELEIRMGNDHISFEVRKGFQAFMIVIWS